MEFQGSATVVVLATYKQKRPQDAPVDVVVHLEPLERKEDYIECLSLCIKSVCLRPSPPASSCLIFFLFPSRYCSEKDLPITVFTMAINMDEKPDFVSMEYIPASADADRVRGGQGRDLL